MDARRNLSDPTLNSRKSIRVERAQANTVDPLKNTD